MAPSPTKEAPPASPARPTPRPRPQSSLSNRSSSHSRPPAPLASITLPPRLAARFTKPTPAGPSSRKSCASSRRSSVSSRSNHHRHGRGRPAHRPDERGPAPASIAQHLRRASILESRRARLASRAAHAEQVRQRALQIQAAPRATTRTRGEDRAAAAKEARERYLAQVAAGCAEEVKRAKRVAEETRLRKREEGLRLRGEVERGLEEAERRKKEYWEGRRARGKSVGEQGAPEDKAAGPPRLAVVPEVAERRPLSEEGASRVVQRAWKGYRRRRVVREFAELNLDVSRVQAATFDEVSALLAREVVQTCTARMLRLCGLLDDGAGETGAAVRVFLSAYLMLGHPHQVLNTGGDQEEDLLDKAKLLVLAFQRVLAKPPTEATFRSAAEWMVALREAHADFQLTFASWKNHDSGLLVDTMLAQFAELDAIWQTVRHDTAGHVAADYREGIRYNQTLLLARLKRLAGPERALKLVQEAVRARRRSKAAAATAAGARARGDVRPRSTSIASEGAGTSLSRPSSAHAAAPLPEASPLRSGPSTTSNEQSPGEGAIPAAALLSPLPSNRVLVHELALNREYRIDVDAACAQRQALNRSLLAGLRAELARGRADAWIAAIADLIRERLLRVVPPNKPMAQQITEALDPDAIAAQLRAGVFSYDKFFAFMAGLLPKLVAPARDPLLKDFVQATGDDVDRVERLGKLLNVVDHLTLDYANHLLAAAAPELLRRAADYEQACFAQLHPGEPANAHLPHAAAWWRAARAQTVAELASRPPTVATAYQALTPPSAQAIYTTGLITLALAPAPLPVDDDHAPPLPEPLALDRARLARWRADTLRLLTAAACLLTAKNLLKRDVRAPWPLAAKKLWNLAPEVLYNADDAAPVLAALCDAAGPAAPSPAAAAAGAAATTPAVPMPAPARAALAAAVPRLQADARAVRAGAAATELTHPVLKVLLLKLRRHVAERLAPGASSAERVRAAARSGASLAQGGLAEFVGRVGDWVEELGRVRSVDWEGHGRWWDAVAERAEGERAGDEQAPGA